MFLGERSPYHSKVSEWALPLSPGKAAWWGEVGRLQIKAKARYISSCIQPALNDQQESQGHSTLQPWVRPSGCLPLILYIHLQGWSCSSFYTECFCTSTGWSFRGANPQGESSLSPTEMTQKPTDTFFKLESHKRHKPHFIDSSQS